MNLDELNTTWDLLRGAADAICDEWAAPDAGIWEMRGPLQHHVYSKVICWAGLDSAITLNRLDPDLFSGDVARWTSERDAIAASVHEYGFSPTRDAYVIAYGSEALDAALLRLPMVGFAQATEARMAATIRQIQSELAVDGLMHRYDATASDGLDPGEGAFAICSFWLVSCLVRLGEVAEAQRLYEHLLGFGNDVGLFAEEIDPASGAALGNFPQGFTHIGIIDAGIDLARALASQSSGARTSGDKPLTTK